MSLDLILVGGGLASCLAAWRASRVHPGLRLLLLEAGDRLGGNHTWSFHEADLPPAAAAWLDPLVTRRWPRYEVRFPGYRRVIDSGYRTIESSHLGEVVHGALGAQVRTRAAVASIDTDHIVIEGTGERLAATAVLDATGHRPSPALRLGYQKFLGQVLEFDRPIELAHPILMDATVPQEDGYRFVYVLPFSEHSALVEDTYYSDTTDLPTDLFRTRIATYARAMGWRVRTVTREETGVLPITLAGDFNRFWPGHDLVARLGLRAGLFHPTTGYSLPDAVVTADLVARSLPCGGAALGRALRAHAEARWRRGSFLRGLNRMLYLAGNPAERFRVLERFYRLPIGLIERFYAGRLTFADKARLLAGKPPVPVLPALAAWLDGTVPAAAPEATA